MRRKPTLWPLGSRTSPASVTELPVRIPCPGTLRTGERPLHVAAHVIAGLGWQPDIYQRPLWRPEEKIVAEELDRTFGNWSPLKPSGP